MYFNLKDRSLIRVTGSDCLKFLNTQFTNNVLNMGVNSLQVNAYCQHQGKIQCLVWLINSNGNFYISVLTELKDKLLNLLNKYKFFSDVDFEDVSSKIYQIGIADCHNPNDLLIKDNLYLRLSNDISSINCSDHAEWEYQCIINLLPELNEINTEKHIPQMINLDLDEFGVSFSKGCYPGQEVVARMHYLGKPKRRLFVLQSSQFCEIGDKLISKESESLKASGTVIRTTNINESQYILAILEVKNLEREVYLENDPHTKLTIVNNPAYALY